MIKVGITGGIGCGKSTVAKYFETECGVPTYLVDNRVRYLINNNKSLQWDIKALIGAEAFLDDGTYNAKMVAAIAFHDDTVLSGLNKCVEPYLAQDMTEFYQAMEMEHCKYVLVEAAYFFEYGMQDKLDFIIGVDATLPIRMSRAQKRDNATSEQIMARINKQMSQEEKMSLCDFVIDNNETLDTEAIVKLDKLFHKIYKYSVNMVCRSLEHGVKR